MTPIRTLVAALAASMIAAPAVAQTPYPDRPIRFIVGFTAGSATDITARIFAEKFAEAWNVPVTVENVPGAAGSVGGSRVAKATADGAMFYWGALAAFSTRETHSTSAILAALLSLSAIPLSIAFG